MQKVIRVSENGSGTVDKLNEALADGYTVTQVDHLGKNNDYLLEKVTEEDDADE
jgi:hypothetical protein